MAIDLTPFTGPAAFGRAYQYMMEHDAHAPCSVDRELVRRMVRLCPKTASELYTRFTSLDVLYEQGSRPRLESILDEHTPNAAGAEEILESIATFTRSLSEHAEQDLSRMQIGGAEEEIVRRGSDWCTDVARVACVLCQIAGFPCRIVYLFDLNKAYSGHVIVEAWREGAWGALDSITGVIYRRAGGQPASTWDLVNDAKLVEAHRDDPRAFYTTVGQFRAAAIANYFCWESGRYDYTVTGPNEYYLSILEMSNRGWPGGIRWLHQEDQETPETPAPRDDP